MTATGHLGLAGEILCQARLQELGHKILETNFNSPFGEVDILTERHGCLWAVEVKCRQSDAGQDDRRYLIRRTQVNRIRKTLQWYAARLPGSGEYSLRMVLAYVSYPRRQISFFQLAP